ncbi:MAG: gliding motility-associated C-terminal domain-containing protein [Lewinellaceae bacterium]|nr:gliding motility-associated C-terminal domain-containing protein [Lewinellaceae bacterium]
MKIISTLLIIFSCLPGAFSQLPPACAIPNPPLAKTCSQSCILCNLDGYTSTTTQTVQGQIIPGYCTQVVHSMGYIGFVAGTTDLSIQVDVGACTLGNSIEMGIYRTEDCQTFDLVSDCNTAMFTGNSYFFSNLEPLVPGCPYFLVFDNNGPASCAFTVTVLSGSAQAPNVAAPEIPSGPTQVCPGAVVEYSIPPVYGACMYRWTAPAGTLINGSPSPVFLDHQEGTTVTVTWGNQSGQLCVNGINPCSQGPNACLPVTVAPIPPTLLPNVTICAGEEFEWLDGNLYTSSQLLSYTYTTSIGCDSTVKQQLFVPPPIVKNLGVIPLCEGECAPVGNGSYCNNGQYQEVVSAANGCDSTINFTILVVKTEAIIALPDTLDCTQDTIILDGSGSSPGSFYTWQNANGLVLSNATMLPVTSPGLYRLIVQRFFAGILCADTALVTVPASQQFPDLTVTGDSLTCANTVGKISAVSNTPGVSYAWNGPGGFVSNLPDPEVTLAGVYTVTLTAPNGCVRQDSVSVSSDFASPVLTTSGDDTLTCSVPSAVLSVQADIAGTGFLWTGPQINPGSQQTVTVNVPGTYYVTGIAPNGCISYDTLLVSIDTITPVLTAAGDTINCASPSGQLTAAFFPTDAIVLWSGPLGYTSSQASPVVAIPGNYEVVVTSGNGCSAFADVVLLADTLQPQVTVSGGTLTCVQGTLNLGALVFPPGSTPVWTGPQNFSSTMLNPAINIAGTYYLTVTGTNGCTNIATAQVFSDTLPPDVIAGGDTITCTDNQAILSLVFTPAGSSVLWNGPSGYTSSQPDPVVIMSGIYTVTVTAPNGCTTTADAEVIADASIPQINLAGGTISCAIPMITLSASVSPTGSDLQWSGPQGFTSNISNPQVSVPGQYLLTVMTANGCVATESTVVTADTVAPTLFLSGDTISCVAPSVTIAAVFQPATSDILWSGPQNFSSDSSATATTIPGFYSTTVTAPNGCTTQGALYVAADTIPPQVFVTGSNITCAEPVAGLYAQVTPTDVTLLWSGPQNFSSTLPDPMTGTTGNYTVIATAQNGCTAIAETQIAADTTAPLITVGGDTITCINNVVSLSVNSIPSDVQLLWTGPQNFTSSSPSPQVTLAGVYMLQSTAANGCTATADVLVPVDTMAPLVTAGGGLITCAQNTLTMSASVFPSNTTVLWNGPQNFSSTVLTPVVNAEGVYQIVATGENGCTSLATAVVEADIDSPVVNATGDTITCTHPAVSLSGNATPASVLLWSGPQNFSSGLSDPVVDVPGTYILTATTSAGCIASDTVYVLTDTMPPVFGLSAGMITCGQPTVEIVATPVPQGSIFQWQGPQNFNSVLPSVTVDAPGSYVATVTAANGCSAVSAVQVAIDTVAPLLNVGGATITCDMPEVQMNLIVQPGTSTLFWTGPQNFTSTQPNPSVTLPGSYNVVATAPNGCTASAVSIVANDADFPLITTTGGTITCIEPFVTLLASVNPPGGIWQWTGPMNFTSTQSNPQVSNAGEYLLTVTLPNGCSASAVAVAEADTSAPEVVAIAGNLTCRSDSAKLEALFSPADCSVLWTGPDAFISTSATTTTTDTGVYVVVATAQNGCTTIAEATVYAMNQPAWMLSLGPDLLVETNELIAPRPQTDLPVQQWSEIDWTFPPATIGNPCTDCNFPGLKLQESGEVSVILTDPNGCSRSATLFIEVLQTSAIYAPNSFAPEGQPGNQYFEFNIGTAAQVVEVRKFRIFDRWGSMVFEVPGFIPGDPHGWDGTINGKPAQSGVYVWYAEFEFANGRSTLLSGDVTLFR